MKDRWKWWADHDDDDLVVKVYLQCCLEQVTQNCLVVRIHLYAWKENNTSLYGSFRSNIDGERATTIFMRKSLHNSAKSYKFVVQVKRCAKNNLPIFPSRFGFFVVYCGGVLWYDKRIIKIYTFQTWKYTNSLFFPSLVWILLSRVDLKEVILVNFYVVLFHREKIS